MASRGVVVNMASLNGQLSFKLLPSLSHTTNKAAIIGMTRQLAPRRNHRDQVRAAHRDGRYRRAEAEGERR